MINNSHISKEDYMELHNKLAQTVIDFFKENGLPEDAWSLDFYIDDLDSSVKAGKWIPFSDSCMSILNTDRRIVVESA